MTERCQFELDDSLLSDGLRLMSLRCELVQCIKRPKHLEHLFQAFPRRKYACLVRRASPSDHFIKLSWVHGFHLHARRHWSVHVELELDRESATRNGLLE